MPSESFLNMPGGEENLNRIYGIREEGVKNLGKISRR